MSEPRFERFVMKRFQKGIETGRILPPLLFVMLMLDFGFALVMWLVDRKNYPTYWEALWFATQTVTTVGYGDNPPTTQIGRFFASISDARRLRVPLDRHRHRRLGPRRRGPSGHTPERVDSLERRVADLEGN